MDNIGPIFAKVLVAANSEGDKLGLISRYVAYEAARNLEKSQYNKIFGSLTEQLQVLLWYLDDYNIQRGSDYTPPLSAAQVEFLNSPTPLVGVDPALTIALFNFLVKHQKSFSDVLRPEALDAAVFWWCTELCPSRNLIGNLITNEQRRLMRRLEGLGHEEYPLSVFMRIYHQNESNLVCLNTEKATDRAALYCYFLLLVFKIPHYLHFLPGDFVETCLSADAGGYSLFEKFLAQMCAGGSSNLRLAQEIRRKGEELLCHFSGGEINWPTDSYRILKSSKAEAESRLRVREEGVAVIGPFEKTSGLGQATRMSYRALRSCEKASPTMRAFNLDNPALVGFASRFDYQPFRALRKINLLHLNAESVPLAFATDGQEIFDRSYNIGYFFWELNKVPECHQLALELLDEIWVSSEYVKDAYAQVTDKPVINVGMAVEQLPDLPKIDPSEFGVDSGCVNFIATFDSFSFIERKNPLAVIESFCRAFPEGDEPVRLIIKTWNRSRISNPQQLLAWKKIDAYCLRDRRIHFTDKTMRYEEVIALKAACDCYVSLHRAEGLGFGIMEAMQLGKPCIITGYSGNMDFCNPDNSFLVDYNLIAVDPTHYPFVEPGSLWADPSREHAAYAMRSIVSDRRAAQEKGEIAAVQISERFGLEAIGSRYAVRLAEIRRNPT